MLSIPYRFVVGSTFFNFFVTIRDELTAVDASAKVPGALVHLRNNAIGFDDQRQTRGDGFLLFREVTQLSRNASLELKFLRISSFLEENYAALETS